MLQWGFEIHTQDKLFYQLKNEFFKELAVAPQLDF